MTLLADTTSTHVGTWKEGLERFPRLVRNFELRPSSMTLLIVDLQNRAVKPEFRGVARLLELLYPDVDRYYKTRLDALVLPNAKRLLEYFRSHSLTVVFLTIGPQLPDGRDWVSPIRAGYDSLAESTGVQGLHPVGSPGHAVIEELRPREDELVINKTTASAFNSTPIDLILRTLRIDTIVCIGVATNACVEHTARDAADRGFKVIIVDDACATWDQKLHDACLRSFYLHLGDVRITDEVLQELGTVLER